MSLRTIILHAQCLAIAFLCTLPISATENPNQAYGRFSTAWVTPHTPWAKPYFHGTLRVAVIAPTFMHRESVELAQRLDAEIIPIMTHSPQTFAEAGGGGSGGGNQDEVPREVVLESAERALNSQWDVIVIGKCQWESIPLKVRYSILSQVHDRGAGLIMVRLEPTAKLADELEQVFSQRPLSDTAGFFNLTVPYKDLPYFKGQGPESLLRLAEFGRGRVLLITYPGDTVGTYTNHSLTPSAHCYHASSYRPDRPDYDHYIGFVARCVTWVARNEADVAITSIGLPSAPIERAGLPAKIQVTLTSSRSGEAPVELNWRIRDSSGTVEASDSTSVKVASGKSQADLTLPALKGGEHYLDLWIKQDGKVLDWASGLFSVHPEKAITSVTVDKICFLRGDPITGKVIASEKPIGVELRDNLGRLLAQASAREDGGFELQVPDPRTTLHYVVARIRDSRGVMSEMRQELSILSPDDTDEFRLAIWGNDLEPISHMITRRCREFGVDSLQLLVYSMSFDRYVDAMRNAARGNFLAQPYMTYVSFQPRDRKVPRDAQGRPLFDPCFRNPGVQTNYWMAVGGNDPSVPLFERLRKAAQAARPLGVLNYNFGDEAAMDWQNSGACFCDYCQKGFREYVKKAYGELSILNAEWGTSLQSWDEITGLTFDEAKKNGQFARWADFRRFMEIGYCDFLQQMVEAVREGDPDARCGIEGVSHISSSFGYDLRRMTKSFKFFLPYDGRVLDKVGSRWMSNDSRVGTIFGLYPATAVEEYTRRAPWDFLFRGMNTALFFKIGFGLGQGGDAVFTPTLDEPMPTFQQAMEEVREIKAGAGRLLLRSQRADDGIRFLYSQMSIHAATIANPAVAEFKDRLSDYLFALEDANLGYKIVSDDDLSSGQLASDSAAKVLLLICARSLSAVEAKAVLDFARGGGLVIADTMPGTMDEHCKQLSRSSLAELFPNPESGHVHSFGKGKSLYMGRFLEEYFRKRRAEKTVTLADGREVPDESAAGDGVSGRDALENAREFSQLIQKHSSAKPRFRFLNADGKSFLDARGSWFDDGETSYLGLIRIRTKGTEQPCTVVFNKPGWIYDVREKRLLGRSDRAQVSLVCKRPRLLAVLPYKVEKLELAANIGTDRLVSIAAKVKASGRKLQAHVLHVTLLRPDGSEEPELARNLTALDGKLEATMQLPFNSPAGKYTCRVRDVASGVSAETRFAVQP